MWAIETRGLCKAYKDVVAVDGLDLTIAEGELFALLGVNGAGKTTTIKMLTTLCRPSGGDALVMGRSVVREPAKVREVVDISMQETAVARKLTVAENIEFYARLDGQTAAQITDTKAYLYATFGLDQCKDKQARRLSGGWQRKLSIALAMATHPQVLFLDEPTLGLDVLARRELWHAIRALKGSVTMVLTTHYMEEAEALADRIGVMQGGHLLFVGTKEELYARTGAGSVEAAFVALAGGDYEE